MNEENTLLKLPAWPSLPVVITTPGPAAPERFLEFFAANVRNPNTRRALARQMTRFLA